MLVSCLIRNPKLKIVGFIISSFWQSRVRSRVSCRGLLVMSSVVDGNCKGNPTLRWLPLFVDPATPRARALPLHACMGSTFNDAASDRATSRELLFSPNESRMSLFTAQIYPGQGLGFLGKISSQPSSVCAHKGIQFWELHSTTSSHA